MKNMGLTWRRAPLQLFQNDPPDGLYMDVGQNGRPRGPQMEKSSLVLTIHNFGVPNFDPSPCFSNISQSEGQEKRTPRQGRSLNTSSLGCGGLLLRKRGGCSVDACSATFYKFYSNIIS